MSKIYMMIGIQGSGKTTYAKVLSKGLSIPIISSDGVRTERPDLEEKDIFPEVYRRCAEIIKNGGDFIYDATNITPKVRQRLRDNLATYGLSDYEMYAYYFEPDVALSTERIKKRNLDPNERFLPLDKIQEFADHLVEPTLDEGFVQIIKISRYYHKKVD